MQHQLHQLVLLGSQSEFLEKKKGSESACTSPAAEWQVG